MKNVVIVALMLFLSGSMMGQGARFSLQMGAAIPIGDIAQNTSHPKKGGFTTTGLDIGFVVERIFKNNFVSGVSIGYAVFGVDEDAIKRIINPTNPNAVLVESQPVQNINIQARGGYNLALMEDKLNITPFIDAGIGVFNSAYYIIQVPNGLRYLRDGNSGVALLVAPGMDISYAVNDFWSIKIFGDYQFANYKVDEKYTLLGNADPIVKLETVNYNYSCVSTGIGATLTF